MANDLLRDDNGQRLPRSLIGGRTRGCGHTNWHRCIALGGALCVYGTRNGCAEKLLQKRARLVEQQAGKSRVQHARIPIPEVAEEIRLDVPFGEEFLVAAETGLAGRKELFVDFGLIEAGHGPTIETERAPP